MPAVVINQRGDIKKSNLTPGQFFWSYVNEDGTTSEGHTYSEGQLWILDNRSGDTVEIGGVRAAKSMVYRGELGSFRGDWKGSSDVRFNHPHEGDYWVADSNIYTKDSKFNIDFLDGDLLLVTKATYENNSNATTGFSDTLKDIEYIKISCSSATVDYKGFVSSSDELTKAIVDAAYGNFWLVKKDFSTDTESYHLGDFILYNKDSELTKISSSIMRYAENVSYTPNAEAIQKVQTFTTDHKTLLASLRDVQTALQQLSIHKAELDDTGHIIYAQLPEQLQNEVAELIDNLANKYQGLWNPLSTYFDKYGYNDTSTDYNLEDNQDDYPKKYNDDGEEIDFYGGDYFIVQIGDPDIQYVQYVDKTTGEVTEFADGDWIIWNDTERKWEKIDNSDRLNSVIVEVNTGDGTTSEGVLTGNVKIKTADKILLRLDNGDIVIYGQRLLNQDPNDPEGKTKYFPIYSNTSDINQVKTSNLLQDGEVIYDEVSLVVGSKSNERYATVWGDVTIATTYNSSLPNKNFNEKHYAVFYNTVSEGATFYDTFTQVSASDRNTLLDLLADDGFIDIKLPEASSTLVGVLDGDEIKKDYITKSAHDGFVTTSTILEEILNSKTFVTFTANNIQVENTYTNNVKFYDFDGYRVDDFDTRMADLIMNPSTHTQITVYLPVSSGTLLTIEEFLSYIMADEHRVPQIINGKAENGNAMKYLVNSPIIARMYGQKLTFTYWIVESGKIVEHTFEYEDTFDVSTNDATKEAFTELNTTKTTSNKINFLSFDAFVQAKKALVAEDTVMIHSKQDGDHYSIVSPSQRNFASSVIYKQPISETQVEQDVVKKIEMPAESGVLLTNNSRVYGGFYRQDAAVTDTGEYYKSYNTVISSGTDHRKKS